MKKKVYLEREKIKNAFDKLIDTDGMRDDPQIQKIVASFKAVLDLMSPEEVICPVYCKNCLYWTEVGERHGLPMGHCMCRNVLVVENFYCGHGHRKGDKEDE